MCSFLHKVCMMGWQLTCMWGRSPLQLSRLLSGLVTDRRHSANPPTVQPYLYL